MKLRSALLLAAIAVSTFGAMVPGHAADPRTCSLKDIAPARTITKIPGAAGTLFYIDDRAATADPTDGNGFLDGGNGFWTFLETNNKPGLQTGGYEVVFATTGDYETADNQFVGEHDRQYCNENGTAHTGVSDTIVS